MNNSDAERPKRVLVTNDDGIDSPGIQRLARAIDQGGFDVQVVAPDYDASGTGAAFGGLSGSTSISFERREIKGLSKPGYAVSGPPALCVLLNSLTAFGERADVVVSGINAGTNMGRSALHSGTVGAALTAQNFGMRGLAVSLSRGAEWHWDVAAQLALDVLNKLIRAPSRCVLNLNVPGRSITEIEGIRWTRLAPYNSVRTAITQTDSNELKLALVRKPYDAAENTDLSLLEEGFATVSSIHGVAEVWNESLAPGDDFWAADVVPAATARDRLHPASSFGLPL